MKDIDLRYEQGVIHMPEELAERAGLPNPYTVDEELATLELVVASERIGQVSAASFEAFGNEDHEAVALHEAEAENITLRTRVLSAILDQIEVARNTEGLDARLEYYFGENGEYTDPIR